MLEILLLISSVLSIEIALTPVLKSPKYLLPYFPETLSHKLMAFSPEIYDYIF